MLLLRLDSPRLGLTRLMGRKKSAVAQSFDKVQISRNGEAETVVVGYVFVRMGGSRMTMRTCTMVKTSNEGGLSRPPPARMVFVDERGNRTGSRASAKCLRGDKRVGSAVSGDRTRRRMWPNCGAI